MARLLHMVTRHFVDVHGLDVLFGHDAGVHEAVVEADVARGLGLLHEEYL